MSTNANELLPEDLLPDIYRKKVAVDTKRYHVGLVPNGPAWNQTFHGISFPMYTSSFDDANNEMRKEGAIVELTPEQCKLIKEAIRNRVVRWVQYPKDHKKSGQRMKAEIYDVRSRGFEPEKSDEPLVKYVYFREAPEVQPTLQANAFEELDKAIKSAEASEAVKAADPEDAATRAKHGLAKKLGTKLGDAGAI